MGQVKFTENCAEGVCELWKKLSAKQKFITLCFFYLTPGYEHNPCMGYLIRENGLGKIFWVMKNNYA